MMIIESSISSRISIGRVWYRYMNSFFLSRESSS